MTDLWKQTVTIYNDIPKTAVEERHFDKFFIDKCNKMVYNQNNNNFKEIIYEYCNS